MNILLCERINDSNQYVEQLVKAYRENGHCVVLDVQNFLYSDYLPDFLHIQWPEAIYRWRHKLPKTENTLEFLRKRLSFYEKSGVPVVYTVHNLLPHTKASGFDSKAYEIILGCADIVVHHGNASVEILERSYPECSGAENIICPHGPYPSFFEDVRKARSMYNLPLAKYVFLNFGRQTPYKGHDFIKEAYMKWREPDVVLFNIGPKSFVYKGNTKIELMIKNMMDCGCRFICSKIMTDRKNIFRAVPHDEIPKIMAASDALFLGHQSGLNSGLLALAASYGKPVVFPDIGNFREQMKHWQWKEVYEAGNVDSAVEALKTMKTRLKEYPPGNICFDNKKWLEYNSWDKHVKNIIDAVKKVEKAKKN